MLTRPRFGLVVMGAFRAIGLLLVAIGVYASLHTRCRGRPTKWHPHGAGSRTRHVLGMVLAHGLPADRHCMRWLARAWRGACAHQQLEGISPATR